MSEKGSEEAQVETASVVPSRAAIAVEPERDDLQHFTATGRPKPKSDHSAWANWQPADFTPVAVQHLPWKFCDDDIISVPVQVRSTPSTTKEQHGERCGIAGWKSKLKKHQSGKSSSTVKVLRMTRGEYLKYWARDEQGNYCGTEPEGVGEGLWKDRMN